MTTIASFRSPNRKRLGSTAVPTWRFLLEAFPIKASDHLGATRKASEPSPIHVEPGIVNLHNSELNFLLQVLSMAKLAAIKILIEPIGSILRLAELIERGDCSA